MKTLRQFLGLLLSLGLIMGANVPVALAGGDPDPHRIYRFDSLPAVDYYSRSFVLSGLKPMKDLTDHDSDEVVHNYPQSTKGFLAGWLQPGQGIAALTETTTVIMVDGSGGQVKVSLKTGEAVVHDTATHEVLAVVRCGNKVVAGKIKLPEPQRIEVPVVREVKINVPVEKPCPCDPDWSWGEIGKYYPKNSRAKKVRLEEGDFVTVGDAAMRQKVVQAIKTADPEFFKRKVQFALAYYNICDGRARLYWYKEGWHWKEFILGFLAGFTTGWFVHGAITDGGPKKEPFFNPGNWTRPMSSTSSQVFLQGVRRVGGVLVRP